MYLLLLCDLFYFFSSFHSLQQFRFDNLNVINIKDCIIQYSKYEDGLSHLSCVQYYHDPVSGRRFRSKKEVLHFLETGTIKKNANSEKTVSQNQKLNWMKVVKYCVIFCLTLFNFLSYFWQSVEGSASKKQKKSSKKARPGVNFDFFDVPAKVEWVLTDSSQWSWTPFIGDHKVPESTAQEWAAAFTVFTIQQSGRTQ